MISYTATRAALTPHTHTQSTDVPSPPTNTVARNPDSGECANRFKLAFAKSLESIVRGGGGRDDEAMATACCTAEDALVALDCLVEAGKDTEFRRRGITLGARDILACVRRLRRLTLVPRVSDGEKSSSPPPRVPSHLDARLRPLHRLSHAALKLIYFLRSSPSSSLRDRLEDEAPDSGMTRNHDEDDAEILKELKFALKEEEEEEADESATMTRNERRIFELVHLAYALQFISPLSHFSASSKEWIQTLLDVLDFASSSSSPSKRGRRRPCLRVVHRTLRLLSRVLPSLSTDAVFMDECLDRLLAPLTISSDDLLLLPTLRSETISLMRRCVNREDGKWRESLFRWYDRVGTTRGKVAMVWIAGGFHEPLRPGGLVRLVPQIVNSLSTSTTTISLNSSEGASSSSSSSSSGAAGAAASSATVEFEAAFKNMNYAIKGVIAGVSDTSEKTLSAQVVIVGTTSSTTPARRALAAVSLTSNSVVPISEVKPGIAIVNKVSNRIILSRLVELLMNKPGISVGDTRGETAEEEEEESKAIKNDIINGEMDNVEMMRVLVKWMAASSSSSSQSISVLPNEALEALVKMSVRPSGSCGIGELSGEKKISRFLSVTDADKLASQAISLNFKRGGMV